MPFPLLSKVGLHLCLILWILFQNAAASPAPRYTDLSSHYEDSMESNPENEAKWLMLDHVRAVSSIFLRNASQICPLGQDTAAEFSAAEKLIHSTLVQVYENEEDSFQHILKYGNYLETIYTLVTKCVQSDDFPRISARELRERNYPERVIHLDLMNHYNDKSKWHDIRSCIRVPIVETTFYSGTAPAVAMDMLWKTYMLAYFGCKEYWISYVDSWDFFETVQNTILLPLLKRWKVVFPNREAEIKKTIPQSTTAQKSSKEDVNALLEKCNVNLFIKHPVDPIPCFKDILI